jgi:HTH-type transcriptional regulator, sugar sensing transcriptional regulator
MDDIGLSQSSLEVIGLSSAEASVYLCLLAHSWLGAPAVADLAGISRSSAYLVLRSLIERGLAEGGEGYGSRFRAVPPERGMAALMDREKELALDRERAARAALPNLVSLAESADEVEDEIIEVLRSPNVVSQRFDRLQLEAVERVDVMVRAPIVATTRGNQAQFTAQKRGVAFRGLYELAAMNDPEVAPYLGRWQEAGEEIRIFRGALPMKLALFDGRIAIMPLPTPGHANGVTSVLIRNEALGAGLQVMFDHLWQKAEPSSVPAISPKVRTDGSHKPRKRETVASKAPLRRSAR